MFQRARDRAGRRGAFLAFLALLNTAVGYSLLTTPAAQRGTMDLLLPWPVWGWVWVAAGVVCAAGVFARRDWWAFTVAAVLMGAWALLSVDLWLVQGQPRGWVSVVIWVAFALTVRVVAGWPEPVRGDLPHIMPPPLP